MSLLTRRSAIAVFLAFAFTYFFAALLRAVTATLSPVLTQEFALNARDLGLLAGGYFVGFAATQLPLGTWLDRHGPKQVLLGFLLVAVAGCVAFALARNFTELLAARVLCGVGVSACLMAPLTGFRRWLPPVAQLRANSWMLMTGSLGMVASTLPVQWLVPVVGWRPLFWGLAALLGISTLVAAWRLPEWPAPAASSSSRAHGYAQVWKHAYFRRMSPVSALCYGGMIAMQALWAGPWLVRVAGAAPLDAAQGLFIINVSMLAAFWCWGQANPWLVRRGVTAERIIATGLPLSFVCLAAIIFLGPRAGAGLWALYCVTSTVLALAQPAVGMAFPPEGAGRALSAFNLIIFIGVFAVQWGVGLAIDGFRALGLLEADAFRAALSLFLACCVMSYGHFVLAKDNSPR